MVAAERGDVAAINKHLAAGADINATSKQTLEGVQYELLADEGTRNYPVARSIVDELGHQTALMFAVRSGRMEAVQRLLDAGADVNAGGGVYCEPETELDACVQIPKAIGWATLGERPDMVELFLQKGAKASDGLIAAAAAAGQTGIVRLLLEHKAPADQGLKTAAAYGQTEAVRLLLDAGAKIDAREDDLCGKTALIHAAEEGHTETVRLLLARGADKNVKSYIDELGACDGDGTALDYATRNGHTQTVNVLKSGEAPTASAGSTPSAEAATPAKTQSGGKSWIEALRSALKPSSPAKTQPDSSAANTRLAAAKRAVAAGADAKALRKEFSSALYDSCGDGDGPPHYFSDSEKACHCVSRAYLSSDSMDDRMSAVRFLLDNGMGVNKNDNDNGTPLEETLQFLSYTHWACEQSDAPVAEEVKEGISKIAMQLISKGAAINNLMLHDGKCYGGNARGCYLNALGVAVESGSVGLVRMLIERGANINQGADKDYDPPLVLASAAGRPDVVKLLLEKGAKDKKAALKAAKDALDYAETEAKKAQYREIISLLESAGAKVSSGNKKAGAKKRK